MKSNMKKYIHNYNRHLERELTLLSQSEIPIQNKELILSFKDHNFVSGHSIPRLLRQCSVLRLVSKKINKPFNEMTSKDFEQFIVWMKKEDYKEESINTYKGIIKVFYKWINKGIYPENVSWIKPNRTNSRKLPEDLFTQEDIKNMLKCAIKPRDKALISVLWESGARIGEVGMLQIKHVQFDEFGCTILLDGKTGMRRIRLISSAPHLLEWINLHPNNHDPSSPIWITLHQHLGEQMVYNQMKKIIAQAGNQAGIKKPLNPHHFRHSRATYMAQFLTEAQMKEYFGWTQDSGMAARYVHLSGKQVDDAILKMYGIKKEETITEGLQREPCPRCKILNDINHQYCKQCWLPLTSQAINEITQTQAKDQETIAAIMRLIELAKSNPQILQQAISQVKH